MHFGGARNLDRMCHHLRKKEEDLVAWLQSTPSQEALCRNKRKWTQDLCRTGKKGEMRQKSHLCKELWGEEAEFRMAGFGSSRLLKRCYMKKNRNHAKL